MQKKVVYLLFCFSLFLGYLHARDYHTGEPAPLSSADAPPCFLPAPANLQYSQSGLYNAAFTWDSVAGASGYYTILFNISAGSQSVNYTSSTNITLPVVPGDSCVFAVAAQCPFGGISPNTSQVEFRQEIIIIDLIATLQGCTPNGQIFSGGPGSTFTHPWNDGAYYFVELKSQSTSSLLYRFRYKTEEERFEFRSLSTNPMNSHLYGQNIFGTTYEQEPDDPDSIVASSNLKATLQSNELNLEGYLSFPTETDLYYYADPDGGTAAFSTIRIYSGCSGVENPRSILPGAGGNANDHARALLQGVHAVNPFTAGLPLVFQEFSESAVSARLFDARGQEVLRAEIQPADITENLYVLRTGDLPAGLYYLRLETAPGVFAVHKVVKM